MTRTPVQSSNVAAIGYDADRQELEVEFRADRNGRAGVYVYESVSNTTAFEVLHGASVGRAVNELKGTHRGRRIATIAGGVERPERAS